MDSIFNADMVARYEFLNDLRGVILIENLIDSCLAINKQEKLKQ